MTYSTEQRSRQTKDHNICVTWSSSGSSPKAGIYLAHSTNTSNCCLIESHTSSTVADFCSDMSVIPTGAVIWKVKIKFPVSLCVPLHFHMCLQFFHAYDINIRHNHKKTGNSHEFTEVNLLRQRFCLSQNTNGWQVLGVRDTSSGAYPISLILYS